MLIYLRNGRKNNDSGWLRKEEASVRKKTVVEGKQRVHLDSKEKDLLAKIHSYIEDVKEHHKTPSKKFSPIADLAYAFGVSTRSVRNSKANDYKVNGTNERKQRSDAGRTLFNSVAKRDQTWTPEMYHSKKQRILAHDRRDGLTNKEIKAGFAMLSEAERQLCEAGSQQMKEMLMNADKLVGDALGMTNGGASSETIACLVAGGRNRVQPASANTIAKYLKNSYGAKCTSKTVPTMSEDTNTVIIEPTSSKLYYSPDPKEQKTNTMTTGLHRIKILQQGVDAPVHATSAICKDSQTSRPRATLTSEIIKTINPTVIDNLVGEVVHIKFESGRKNTVFFASSTSTCPLLKHLYNCFEESRHKLEILVKGIPNSLWISDTLAGGNYIPMGVSFRSGTQGSNKKLPFLWAECSNNRLICISRIYAKLLGIEAAIIKKYCPETYKTNHDTYRGGEDCMFPPIHEQHAGQTTSELFHFYLNQVALRVLYNETDKTEEQLHRCAMHTDDGDVSTDQPLTFLSFGGEEGSGGEVSGSH